MYTDSDWAGDVVRRRSTSGGVVMVNGMVVAHWSKLQSNVALSSGDAELNAAVTGIAETIGVYELLSEWKLAVDQVSLCIDASACKGILLRKGVGRMKHLSTKQLWVQEAVSTYNVCVYKIPRSMNFSDSLTHNVSGEQSLDCLSSMRYRIIPPVAKVGSMID